MRSSSIFVSSLLTLLPLAPATTCDSSVAQPWPTAFDPANATGGGSAVDACDQKCGNDSACLQTCLDLAGVGECNSVGCSDTTSSDGSSDSGGSASDFIKRASSGSLDCSSSQDCYVDPSGALGCIDLTTGDFVDETGGTGNVNTGSYTAASGQSPTTASAGDSASTTTTESAQTETSQTASTEAASQTAATTKTSALSSSETVSATGAAASQSTGAAASNLDHARTGTGVIVGALGLIAGMVI